MSFKTHFKIALALGLIFRLLTAYFAYGPLAMDDYIDGVSPALQWAGGEWPKLSTGRSYLLVWFLGSILKVARGWPVVWEIRFLYAVLGILSLSMIYVAYRYVRSTVILYLLAIYCFLPFANTRAFGESVAMPWVLAGVLVPYPFLSGLFLGVASLFRFQCGLLFLTLLFFWRKRFLPYLAAGLVVLGLQVLIDLGSGYSPLQTFTDYWARNQGWAVEYGVQPWYSHLATTLGILFFPFCLFLRPKLKEHWPVVASIGVFLLFHSLIPHKEARFLFPILPLILLLMASGWTKRFQWAFLLINTLLLFVVTFSNPQASMVEPIVEAQRRYEGGLIIETDNDLVGAYIAQGVFLKKPFRLERIEKLEPKDIPLEMDGPVGVMITGFEIPEWVKERSECFTAGSLTDRLLYRFNPSHNNRRQPNTYCFLVTSH